MTFNKTKYIKITDKYLFINDSKKQESHFIKNGKVDDVNKLIKYLSKVLNNNLIKDNYIFILDTLLTPSDIFVYKYVFDSIGLLNYKIINDLDLIKNELNKDNIIILNWNSSINYIYLNNDEIVINKYNNKIINNLNKKYILVIGDSKLNDKFNKKVHYFEDFDKHIFNCI